MESTSR